MGNHKNEDKIMAAKLYQIKNKEGNFYNAHNNFFTERLCIGSYATSRRESEAVIAHFELQDCEVFETTELEFTQEMAGLTTRVIIQLESTRKLLEDIRYILPTISQINKNTGKHIKNCAENLKLITPYFNQFLKVKEDPTDEVAGLYDEFIYELSKVELYECESLTHVLKAFQKDKKSLKGICNKILKN